MVRGLLAPTASERGWNSIQRVGAAAIAMVREGVCIYNRESSDREGKAHGRRRKLRSFLHS